MSGSSSGIADAGAERGRRATGANSSGSRYSSSTTTFAGSSWAATAYEPRSRGREVSAQRPLDAQRSARLHHDLACVHHVRDDRAARAAAQPYHEWSELECTTSTWRRRASAVSRATATGQFGDVAGPRRRTSWLVDSRGIGTTCRVAPAASNSAASGDGPGTAMWKSNSPRGRLRTSRRSAWSDPPRSATGCTERIVIVRVAVNVEQLLHEAPGGIGRYTAELVRLLPALAGRRDPVHRPARARRRRTRAAATRTSTASIR